MSGVTLQILFGLCTIRWETGRNILKCFGDNVVNFLNFGLEGATFVYGETLIVKEMVFAFQVTIKEITRKICENFLTKPI